MGCWCWWVHGGGGVGVSDDSFGGLTERDVSWTFAGRN